MKVLLYLVISLICGIFGQTIAQFHNRIILEPPIPSLCAQRVVHERASDNKGYFFSWRDPLLKDVEEDWLGARNFCRRRCMDTVSLENYGKNEWIKQKIVQDNVKYIWTSGRLCDFEGCQRKDLQPISKKGWFWSSILRSLPATDLNDQGDWSQSGGLRIPQPDNREFKQGGAPESCLAVLNQFYQDGVNWHDVACHHRKPFVCEDNDILLKFVAWTNPNLRL